MRLATLLCTDSSALMGRRETRQMDEIVFFTIDAGEDLRPRRTSKSEGDRDLHSARVRDRRASSDPIAPQTRRPTQPGFIRLYEMAAAMRERRHDAQQRAAQHRRLRDTVELQTASVHRNKRAGDVFVRNYPKYQPRRTADKEHPPAADKVAGWKR